MLSKTLGHYTIGKKIGEGGMGTVYEGEDTRLLRRVAIKVVPSPRTRDQRQHRHLIHEARMASAINHPNICTIYDVGQHASWYYIVMEYVEGETLREIIERRGPFPENEAARIGAQVCDALAAAHKQGVVHRDIKPDNIMISADGQIKIMDFGLARLIDEAATRYGPKPQTDLAADDPGLSVSGLAGTTLYMAPEQIDEGRGDERTDVYALGAVLYELLTGEPPFRGADTVSLITAILEAPTPSPDSSRPELSTAICKAVRKALARDPASRFQSIEAFGAALAEIAVPHKEQSRLFRTFWPVATLLLALLLGGAFWLQTLQRDAAKIVNVRELRPADQPEGNVVLAPDGRRIAYLVNSRTHPAHQSLMLEDVRSGETRRIDLSAFRNDPFRGTCDWSPDMRWVVLSLQRGGLLAIDISGTTVRRFSDFGFEARWAPDGRRIVFSRFDPIKLTKNNEIWLYDLGSQSARQISPRDGRSYSSPSWSPDSRRVVCVGGIGSDRGLWILDTEDNRTELLFGNQVEAQDPVWSGSGRFVYFNRAGSELWRVPVSADARAVPERVFKNRGFTPSQLSGNGHHLLLNQQTLAEQLWRFSLPLGGGSPWEHGKLLLRPQNWGITNLAVAPSGDYLVLETNIENRRALMRVDLHRANREVLYDDRDAFAPAFSPDGKWLAFDAGGGDHADIWRMALNHGTAEKLFEHPGADWMPRYAPDGKTLSFVSNRDGQFDLWLFDLEERTFQKVTDTPAMESGGYWSGDGRKLAFFRIETSESRSSVWILDWHTGRETRVYDLPNNIIDATTTIAWGPEDRTLFFSDGLGLRELDLVTGKSRRPFDSQWSQTPHARYATRADTLYVIQRQFVSNYYIAEVRE